MDVNIRRQKCRFLFSPDRSPLCERFSCLPIVILCFSIFFFFFFLIITFTSITVPNRPRRAKNDSGLCDFSSSGFSLLFPPPHCLSRFVPSFLFSCLFLCVCRLSGRFCFFVFHKSFPIHALSSFHFAFSLIEFPLRLPLPFGRYFADLIFSFISFSFFAFIPNYDDDSPQNPAPSQFSPCFLLFPFDALFLRKRTHFAHPSFPFNFFSL